MEFNDSVTSEKDAKSVRDDIINTAAKLFAERGVHATSLADIAAVAELSKGTLYYYFPAKEDLTQEICEIHIEKLSEILIMWIEDLTAPGFFDNCADKVDFALSHLIDCILNSDISPQLHIALYAEAALADSPLKQLFAECLHNLCVVLEVGALRIPTEIFDNTKLSRAFFMILDGYILHTAMGVDTISKDDLFAYIKAWYK
ncbi:MAG: TetR/AcrR family transcriptional regulator [Clostridiales bacterium]|jgi:AcrR family transcriptional regulator|nr:TetR/AcrR family transcriptional regulator [Clostridiales bacterium]